MYMLMKERGRWPRNSFNTVAVMKPWHGQSSCWKNSVFLSPHESRHGIYAFQHYIERQTGISGMRYAEFCEVINCVICF